MSQSSALRSFTDGTQRHALGIFRIVVGFLFLTHGVSKLVGVWGVDEAVAFGTWPAWWAAIIELVGGSLVLLGIGTRSAAFISSGAMAYAYFSSHQPDGLLPVENGGDAAALYSWIFLLLIFTGPGAFALDSLFRRDSDRASSRTGEPQAQTSTA